MPRPTLPAVRTLEVAAAAFVVLAGQCVVVIVFEEVEDTAAAHHEQHQPGDQQEDGLVCDSFHSIRIPIRGSLFHVAEFLKLRSCLPQWPTPVASALRNGKRKLPSFLCSCRRQSPPIRRRGKRKLP